MALHPVGPSSAWTYSASLAVLLVVVLLVVVLLVLALLVLALLVLALLVLALLVLALLVVVLLALSLPVLGAGRVGVDRRQSYPVGSRPGLAVSARNAGTTACRRALGPAAVDLLVYSASDRIFSPRDCSPGSSTGTLVLSPGEVRTTEITWLGLRSLPGCAGTRAPATAGTYRVLAQVGSLRSSGPPLLLTSG